MKDNFKLIAITVAFVLTGVLLAFVSVKGEDLETFSHCVFEDERFSVGDEVVGYSEGNLCTCAEGGIVECVPLDVEDFAQLEVSQEDLQEDNLKFEYSYITGVGENGDDIVFGTKFTNVAIGDDELIITLEQMQTCSETNSVSEQEGFYDEVNGALKLYNNIDSENGGISCIVELKYIIEGIENFELDKINIVFVDANGIETYALICIYDEIIYSDDDVFKNQEGLICLCDSGEIICDEDLSD